MTVLLEPPGAPPALRAALSGLRAALVTAARPGLVLREVPAPTRLAPFAVAMSAEVSRDGQQVGTGRFVVLHDPVGQDGWRGDTRVVTFVSADVEAEMAADGALAEVGWSWLTEALSANEARHTAAGGTVTRTTSTRFGALYDASETSEVEIRASWTALPESPGQAPDLGRHLAAWCELLAATAGLPPPGVTVLPGR